MKGPGLTGKEPGAEDSTIPGDTGKPKQMNVKPGVSQLAKTEQMTDNRRLNSVPRKKFQGFHDVLAFHSNNRKLFLLNVMAKIQRD